MVLNNNDHPNGYPHDGYSLLNDLKSGKYQHERSVHDERLQIRGAYDEIFCGKMRKNQECCYSMPPDE